MDFTKFFSFDGRISRRSFWFSALVIMGFGVILDCRSAEEARGRGYLWNVHR
jgi:uncharacterized membrane protein YhaH (DUF805 family)